MYILPSATKHLLYSALVLIHARIRRVGVGGIVELLVKLALAELGLVKRGTKRERLVEGFDGRGVFRVTLRDRHTLGATFRCLDHAELEVVIRIGSVLHGEHRLVQRLLGVRPALLFHVQLSEVVVRERVQWVFLNRLLKRLLCPGHVVFLELFDPLVHRAGRLISRGALEFAAAE